jgi:hypothetical protein
MLCDTTYIDPGSPASLVPPRGRKTITKPSLIDGQALANLLHFGVADGVNSAVTQDASTVSGRRPEVHVGESALAAGLLLLVLQDVIGPAGIIEGMRSLR